MQYNEFPPCDLLKYHVKCIWVLEAPADSQPDFEKIFPDGSAELIFHFGDPFESRAGNKITIQDKLFVYGQISRYIELRPSGVAGVLGVRFKPSGLAAFSDASQSDLTDKVWPVAEVFRNPGSDMPEKLSGTSSIREKIAIMEDFLVSNLASDPKDFDAEILRNLNYLAARFSSSANNSLVSEIAASENISRRELERRFKYYVGLSPKQLIKIARFQKVLNKSFKAESLTELAYLCGYYDQSHFIRDFKEFAGITPAAFLKQPTTLTEIFYDN